ncbi:uncharacterized protein LOC134722599 [Mytilus trossulus]|uniref:uncharacterized protein LOC134722599 n=1 Tax=Mytilus trossulus TaxID=6551 RepID=UPI003005A30E
MACQRFLNFRPTDTPLWRKRDKKYEVLPTVEEMIKDIVNFYSIWSKKERTAEKDSFAETKREMMMEFLFRLQQDENIGLDEKDKFEHVVNDELKSFEKTGQKRKCPESTVDTPRHSNCNESSSEKQRSDQDSLPNTADIKDFFNFFPTDKDSKKDNKMIETRNLLRGYRHLKHEVKELSVEEQSSYIGEIDVEICIQKCHEVLMRDLPYKTKTDAGKFSVLQRVTNFDGEDFLYPWFATEEVAFQAVDTIVLEYNKMVMEISTKEDKQEQIDLSLKCATVMLFAFLSLHPFSNGNGRLARLLCSHCLKVFCPFPTPIYNVFSQSNKDDYLKAVVNARQNIKSDKNQKKKNQKKMDSDCAMKHAQMILEQKPNELCSLVIESNWFTWRQFLHRIGEDIELFDFERQTREIIAS